MLLLFFFLADDRYFLRAPSQKPAPSPFILPAPHTCGLITLGLASHGLSGVPSTPTTQKEKASVTLLSPVRLCDPWTVAHQAPLSVEFSKQEY